ncbi:XRE family transcriptional regulator [bacterium D16-50]|nr:XRE family transcriptional regulator [bacterium D16-50]
MRLYQTKSVYCKNHCQEYAVSELLGCHEGVYRRYENGVREIPLWALLKLAEWYDVSVDYILGITDNRRKYGE